MHAQAYYDLENGSRQRLNLSVSYRLGGRSMGVEGTGANSSTLPCANWMTCSMSTLGAVSGGQARPPQAQQANYQSACGR
jgi:hypothetical protein